MSKIATGIDVDSCKETGVRQKTGRTALILAIWEKHSEIVEILLQAGADPNLMDEDSGTTPLICAVRVQNIEIVDLLVRSGADINARDISQNTALNIAKQLGNSEIVHLLQKAENKDYSI